MSEDVKYMDIKEFRELGFLQEANRLFFHPHGLALSIMVEEDGTEALFGIWDYRDDPEGVWYDFSNPDSEYASEGWQKYENVLAERQKHSDNRSKMFTETYGIQAGDIEPIVIHEEDSSGSTGQ